MSEASITLPLSMFGDMPLDQVIEAVKGFGDMASKVEAAQRNETALAQKLVDWSHVLQTILDADYDDFRRAQALRELLDQTKQFTNFVKGKIQ